MKKTGVLHGSSRGSAKNAGVQQTEFTSRHFGPYAPFLISAGLLLLFLSGARLAFVAMNLAHVSDIGDLLQVMAQGLRVDLASVSRLYVLPLVLFVFSRFLPGALQGPVRWVCILLLTVVVALFAFFEVITPTYLLEFGTRPERKFFEYLDAPAELIGMLWGSFRVQALTAFAVVVAAFVFAFHIHRLCFERARNWSYAKTLASVPIVLFILVVAGRSTFDGKALHPGLVAFTNDLLLNNLALNSLFSVSYARYRMLDEVDPGELYGEMPTARVQAYVRPVQKGLSHAQAVIDVPAHRKNIVIILEESLGARFVKSLGGRDLTPNLDVLARDGWWFERMYATGTRSVRGIEAVLSGFPPTPGRSVVKLLDSQSKFFTLAAMLGGAGYRTGFYYGGNSDFDNMRGFTLSNGFDYVFDEADIHEGKFRSTYGYSDEDIFDAIHERLESGDGPAEFIFTLTTSNHQPFHFPVEQGEQYKKPLFMRDNAVRYADKALGAFIRRAKASDYWKDTIFLIVADHDARVSPTLASSDSGTAEALFPLEGFHIPALIIGGGIQPKSSQYIASQIDLPTTLLGLAGIEGQHPMTGVDLTKVDEDYRGSAIMQFADHQAHLDEDGITLLRPSQPPLSGHIIHGKFVPAAGDAVKRREQRALAFALWPGMVYRAGKYTMKFCAPDTPATDCVQRRLF